jgi:hypothetical protein
MKKIMVLALTLSSLSAFCYGEALRLDKSTIASISSSSDCPESNSDIWKFDGVSTITVKTVDGKNVNFVEISTNWKTCEIAKSRANSKNLRVQILLFSISKGTLKYIEQKDSVLCVREYLDVVIDEQGQVIPLGSFIGETPVKCPN